MSESELSRQIGRWLDQQQALRQLTHDRYNSGVAVSRSGRRIVMAEPGTSDRIVRVRLDDSISPAVPLARPVMLEVKQPGCGVQVPVSVNIDWRDPDICKRYAQYQWMERQRLIGAYCCVVHSLEATRRHVAAAAKGEPSPGPTQWAMRIDR